MKKTTKEYAEKMARDYQDTHYIDTSCDSYKNGVSDYVQGYLAAIEENNLVGLIRSLELITELDDTKSAPEIAKNALKKTKE